MERQTLNQQEPGRSIGMKGLALSLLFWSWSFMVLGQTYDNLTAVKGFKTQTYCSKGNEERAGTLASRCDKVMQYYKTQIGFEPNVTLLVLTPADWPKHTNFPVYGMPHYKDKQTLIIASEDNAFWKSFIPPVDKLPKSLADQITQTYTNSNGTLSMQPFFDLLAIHELGHAYHEQGGLTMQRKWMGELFVNMLLHSYIAENEPENLPALTVFPQMVVAGGKNGMTYTTLTDLENRYTEIGQKYPRNYGWYQCRLHSAAKDIYDKGGVPAFTKLWTSLKDQKERLSDQELTTFLQKNVHQSVADVLVKWDE